MVAGAGLGSWLGAPAGFRTRLGPSCLGSLRTRLSPSCLGSPVLRLRVGTVPTIGTLCGSRGKGCNVTNKPTHRVAVLFAVQVIHRFQDLVQLAGEMYIDPASLTWVRAPSTALNGLGFRALGGGTCVCVGRGGERSQRSDISLPIWDLLPCWSQGSQ